MEQLPLFSSTGNLGYAVRLVEKLNDCQHEEAQPGHSDIENILPTLPLYHQNKRKNFFLSVLNIIA